MGLAGPGLAQDSDETKAKKPVLLGTITLFADRLGRGAERCAGPYLGRRRGRTHQAQRPDAGRLETIDPEDILAGRDRGGQVTLGYGELTDATDVAVAFARSGSATTGRCWWPGRAASTTR